MRTRNRLIAAAGLLSLAASTFSVRPVPALMKALAAERTELAAAALRGATRHPWIVKSLLQASVEQQQSGCYLEILTGMAEVSAAAGLVTAAQMAR